MTDSKVCTKCKEYKPLSEYNKQTGRYLNVKSSCKECNKPKKRLHYQNNKEKYKRSYQEFIRRNPNYQREYYNQHN